MSAKPFTPASKGHTMTQHTLTPWHPAGDEIHDRATEFDKHGARIGDTPNSICEMHLVPFGAKDANRDFILRAVNCHDDLLAAVKDAAHDIKYVLSQPWSKRSQGDTDTLRHRLNCLIASIAKATE